jgi:hypothetical protein
MGALFARNLDDCEQQVRGDVRWERHASELRLGVLSKSEEPNVAIKQFIFVEPNGRAAARRAFAHAQG